MTGGTGSKPKKLDARKYLILCMNRRRSDEGSNLELSPSAFRFLILCVTSILSSEKKPRREKVWHRDCT